MADRYWVGGTANWDGTAGTKWAATSGGTGGETVPTLSDNVFFDAASGTVTATISATANCENLNFTGFTGTIAGTSALNVYGSLTLSTGMTRTYSGVLTMRATATGKTITMNGKSLANITFAGAGGGWTLQDSFTISGSAYSNQITHTNGTLDTNGVSVSCNNYRNTGTSTRELILGASTFTCTGASGGPWEIASSTGMTLNAGTSTIIFSNNSSNSRTFTGAGFTYNKLTIGGNTATSTLTFVNSNTFSEIDTTKTVAHTLSFTSGTTTTVTTWSITGGVGKIVSIRSSTAGSSATLAKAGGGTVTVNYADIRDSTASPTYTWYATNSTDSGNNSNWTFGAPPTAAFLMFFM